MSYLFRRAILTVIVAVIVGYFGDHAIHQPHAEHPPKLSAILVTGASSGIGRAAAFALFEHGFVVYAGVRDTSALEELKTHGTRMRPLLLDVSKQQHIDDAFATITAAAQVAGGGQLVGIVNNAGTTYKRPLETADLDSIISMPMQGPYAATKHAVEALSDTLRQELAPFGVSVSMVNPGYINTGIRGKGSPSRREGNKSLTAIEQRVYYHRFESLWNKDDKHSALAPACCPQTDAAILHALISPYPQTRYYPNTAAVAIGDWFPAWVAAIIIRAFSIHPRLDRLKDLVVARFF